MKFFHKHEVFSKLNLNIHAQMKFFMAERTPCFNEGFHASRNFHRGMNSKFHACFFDKVCSKTMNFKYGVFGGI